MTFERVPADTESGIMPTFRLLQDTPSLFLGQVGADFLNVFDAPDDGDLVAKGKDDVNIIGIPSGF
jgi:hypothetical protein